MFITRRAEFSGFLLAAVAAGIGLIWWSVDLYRLAGNQADYPAPAGTA